MRVWRPGGLCCSSSFAVRIVYLINFEACPVPGLQPDRFYGSCFPGAGAPGCGASGFQPGFSGLGSAAHNVGRSISRMYFFSPGDTRSKTISGRSSVKIGLQCKNDGVETNSVDNGNLIRSFSVSLSKITRQGRYCSSPSQAEGLSQLSPDTDVSGFWRGVEGAG